MSRLDRLVSLLDTGTTQSVRNVAAEQLADIQKAHPEELFGLLGRVVPYLKSKSWDTRLAAGKALGLIVSRVTWLPSNNEIVATVKSEPESTCPNIKTEDNVDDNSVLVKQESEDKFDPAVSSSAGKQDKAYFTFETLNLKDVLLNGTKLMSSIGKEYETPAVSQGDQASRVKAQHLALKQKLGMTAGFGDDVANDILIDDDLDLAPPPPKTRGRAKAVRKSISRPEPEKLSAVNPAPTGGNAARMRALAKRKAKFSAKEAQNKVHVVDVAPKSGDDQANNSKVVVEHRHDNAVQLTSMVTVKDSREWPFEALCDFLMENMFDHTWEVRHGALIGLREVMKTQGMYAGMSSSRTEKENAELNSKWLEDLTCRLCCIFALDRFGDYVADQVVAPVRESGAQTLGAVLLTMPSAVADSAFEALTKLVLQHELGFDSPVWAVCHGGLLGLRYFVSIRTDLFLENPQKFERLVECVFFGLANDDDDVQAISAATLLPVAGVFVQQQPRKVPQLLSTLWNCLGDVKDELSTSIGNIMDLLAKLCSFKEVLEVIASETGSETDSGFAELVPRLYPFLRHSITDVRKAVLRSLKTLVMVGGGSETEKWVNDVRLFRLIFQNILLEQNDEVASLSLEVFKVLLGAANAPNNILIHWPTLCNSFWPVAIELLMTPIGTARKFYPINGSLLLTPTGQQLSEDLSATSKFLGPNTTVKIDGPMINGDVLLIETRKFVRARLDGSCALGSSISYSDPEYLASQIPEIRSHFTSPMSTQRLTVCLLLEEIAKTSKDPEQLNVLRALEESLLEIMNTDTTEMYRDLNPVLRAVRTQCQSLFSLMSSQGSLSPEDVPQLTSVIEGDPNAGPSAFSLTVANKLATTSFVKLKSKLPIETQVSMEHALDEGRRNLIGAIEEAKESLDKRNVCIKAAAAGAYLHITEKLPSKLNPLIRSLMDSIKLETDPLLHLRTAQTLANLVSTLNSTGKESAASKIIKNLCAFLCVDISEAPEFVKNCDLKNKVMALIKDEPIDDVFEVLRKQKEGHDALIKRKGALLVLGDLAHVLQGELYETLPELLKRTTGSLERLGSDSSSQLQDPDFAQDVIDNLAVLRATLQFLPSSLQEHVLKVFDNIRNALFCEFSVLRFVAAKCFGTINKMMPTEGISYLVEHILPQMLNMNSLCARQGASETMYFTMTAMGETILPYLVFFVVPVLGRMSDSDPDVRTIAASTFATIMSLISLESGAQDPPNIPVKLLEGRDKEREFISQMMDVSKIKPFELPITVKAELRKYQQEGVNWLAFLNRYHLHGILCDDMGLGKTLQTICIVSSDHHNRKVSYEESNSEDFAHIPSLIVCPTTLTGHWMQEFKNYVPSLKTLAYVGTPSARSLLSSKIPFVDIVVTSYDVARNDVDDLCTQNWNYCVLDEGHIIKNSNAKLSRALKMYRSNHRLILTGTPIQNNVLELWSLFDFLMPGFLGTEKSFDERFSRPILASKNAKTSSKEKEAAALALEALHKQVLPFLLRRLKEDVLSDLPPKIIQDFYCDLNERQKKLYDKFAVQQKESIAEDLVGSTDAKAGRSQKQHVFQALLYLRRVCNHPALVSLDKKELAAAEPLDYTASPKLLALQQLLNDCGIGVSSTQSHDEVPEAMSQHRALVFCQQRDMLDLVEKSLFKTAMPNVSYLRLDRSVPGPQRHEMVSKFNEDPSIDVLLLTTHVGGLGLNLTGADTVIFVEHDWNPMNDLQAMDRAHRIGQKKVVNVYRLITRGTLEERIMGLQAFKLNIASTVVNQQNNGLGSMDTGEILDLFSGSVSTTQEDDQTPKRNAEIEGVDITGKPGGKDVTAGLTELWDESQYTEEYDLDSFIKSLKSS